MGIGYFSALALLVASSADWNLSAFVNNSIIFLISNRFIAYFFHNSTFV